MPLVSSEGSVTIGNGMDTGADVAARPGMPGPHSNQRSFSQTVISELARQAGFTSAGVAALPHANTPRDAERFERFVEAGHAGSMEYLGRRNDSGELIRTNPRLPFPWARSVVVCLASYHADAPLSIAPAPPGAGWIARYAWSSRRDDKGNRVPSDYHKVLLKRLRALESAMRGSFGEFESRAYVDTGPLVERNLAQAAGLGWTGKNTCLIHTDHGSWNFLSVIVTSLELAPDEQAFAIPDRCGSCRRCLDACPTNALIEPYRMDATRCISYLTIEHRGEIADELKAGMGRQVFGCDICQDVCPWNGKLTRSLADKQEGRSGLEPRSEIGNSGLEPRAELVNPALEWLASLDYAGWEKLVNGSPIRRAGFEGLRRNLAIAMGNSGLGRFRRQLEEWSAFSKIPGAELTPLESAARWALDRLAPDAERD